MTKPNTVLTDEEIIEAMQANGCERIKDFYSVGPVQKAAVMSFAYAIEQAVLAKQAAQVERSDGQTPRDIIEHAADQLETCARWDGPSIAASANCLLLATELRSLAPSTTEAQVEERTGMTAEHRDAFLFAVRQIPERHVLAVLRAWQPGALIPRQSKRSLAMSYAKGHHAFDLNELRAACKDRMNATKQP